MNDVSLPWKRIYATFPEQTHIADGGTRGWTRDEIQKILLHCRGTIDRAIILVAASSGIGVGGFEGLQWRDLTPICYADNTTKHEKLHVMDYNDGDDDNYNNDNNDNGNNNKKNNNGQARFNSTQHSYYKSRRGIKTTDSVVFTGFAIWYNFVRKYTAIKCTPAEATGVHIHGHDRWRTLIGNACMATLESQ